MLRGRQRRTHGVEDIAREEDPGVASVTRIYQYYKKFGYDTQVMGASFRKTTQVLDLAGCDLLTISPELLEQLSKSQASVSRRLDAQAAQHMHVDRVRFDEKHFRFDMNEDAMASDKLAEGIRQFVADAVRLEQLVLAAR